MALELLFVLADEGGMLGVSLAVCGGGDEDIVAAVVVAVVACLGKGTCELEAWVVFGMLLSAMFRSEERSWVTMIC